MAFNHGLAASLGITYDEDTDLAAVFSGNVCLPGAEPIAQVYAGHQFGGFSGQLGDGRAHLLGEVCTPKGRFDIQLKGSGPTPFSRRGDGRAWAGPCDEGISGLGVHACAWHPHHPRSGRHPQRRGDLSRPPPARRGSDPCGLEPYPGGQFLNTSPIAAISTACGAFLTTPSIAITPAQKTHWIC